MEDQAQIIGARTDGGIGALARRHPANFDLNAHGAPLIAPPMGEIKDGRKAR